LTKGNANDYVNKASQYENEMLQHRFLLDDLAQDELTLIATSKKGLGQIDTFMHDE
jgi:hypothetical protein